MIRRTITAAATAAALAAGTLAAAAPAYAATSPSSNVAARYSWPYPGILFHSDPDRGFDDPITVRCREHVNSPLVRRRIAEGQASNRRGCFDVEQVYLAIGQEITCTSDVPFVDDWSARGHGMYVRFPDNPLECVNGLTS